MAGPEEIEQKVESSVKQHKKAYVAGSVLFIAIVGGIIYYRHKNASSSSTGPLSSTAIGSTPTDYSALQGGIDNPLLSSAYTGFGGGGGGGGGGASPTNPGSAAVNAPPPDQITVPPIITEVTTPVTDATGTGNSIPVGGGPASTANEIVAPPTPVGDIGTPNPTELYVAPNQAPTGGGGGAGGLGVITASAAATNTEEIALPFDYLRIFTAPNGQSYYALSNESEANNAHQGGYNTVTGASIGGTKGALYVPVGESPAGHAV